MASEVAPELVERLDWDSNFFGFPVGRIRVSESKPTAIATALREAEASASVSFPAPIAISLLSVTVPVYYSAPATPTANRRGPSATSDRRRRTGPRAGRGRHMPGWTFAELWERAADELPDAPFAMQGERVVSWGDADRRADGVAATLLAAGAQRQDKVAQYLYYISAQIHDQGRCAEIARTLV